MATARRAGDDTPPVAAAARERLFFAIWPDARVRAALTRLQTAEADADARPVRPANLHMTLLFVGDCGATLRGRLLEAAGQVSVPAFEITLGRVGGFAGGILWSAPDTTTPALTGLAASLAEAARAAGAVMERRPFRAHVTLARRAAPRAHGVVHAPIAWPVREFGLYASRRQAAASVYRRLAAWRLG